MVNLVLCLLSTRQFLTAEQIRRAVPGYEADDNSDRADEAFKRMFERDKAELRELGIPLETGRTSFFDTDDGYRIARRDYELPEIEFDPAEAAAVGLASRLWQSATLGSAARTALLKLRAGGVEVDDRAAPGAVPHIDSGEPGLSGLLEAVQSRRAVRFDYRKSGTSEPESRTVEPWGVLSWHGRWYLVGFDRERKDSRSFRLSRVAGAIKAIGGPNTVVRPEGVNLVDYVQGRTPDEIHTARVRIEGHGGGRLRRMARTVLTPDACTGGTELIIDYTEAAQLARVVAAAGSAAVVLGPPELIAQVKIVLQASLSVGVHQ
ncbi:MAG: Proteasome accessory factor [Pseudonocardiales bacterium]|nr:Proteasome accessory factor [Pseudonocardiales bacterium]